MIWIWLLNVTSKGAVSVCVGTLSVPIHETTTVAKRTNAVKRTTIATTTTTPGTMTSCVE